MLIRQAKWSAVFISSMLLLFHYKKQNVLDCSSNIWTSHTVYFLYYWLSLFHKIAWCTMLYDYVSKTLEKYIIKILSIDLWYSKEFEALSASSKMACSDMTTFTAKQCFSKLPGIVTLYYFVWTTYRCAYITTGWLVGGILVPILLMYSD